MAVRCAGLHTAMVERRSSSRSTRRGDRHWLQLLLGALGSESAATRFCRPRLGRRSGWPRGGPAGLLTRGTFGGEPIRVLRERLDAAQRAEVVVDPFVDDRADAPLRI